MNPDRPNLVIVGAMRAGTTALYQHLTAFDDVAGPAVKEPSHLFRSTMKQGFAGPGDEHLNRTMPVDDGEYLSLWSASVRSRSRYLLDGSVAYLGDLETLALVPEYFHDAHFVVCLRNPYERLRSAFSYQRARGREPLTDIHAALEAEPERRASGWSPMFRYLGASCYSDALYLLQETAGDRLSVVFTDDPNGLARQARELTAQLGLPEREMTPSRVNGSDGGDRTSLRRLREQVRHRGFTHALPLSVRRSIGSTLDRTVGRGLRKQHSNNPPSLPLPAAVIRTIDADIAAVASLTNRNLSNWTAGLFLPAPS